MRETPKGQAPNKEGGEKNETLKTFSHGREFLGEAVTYLESENIRPEWGQNYALTPDMPTYKSFLNFFISELENLPFDNQVGETKHMRPDSHEVIQKLVVYLKKKSGEISQTAHWRTDDLGEIEGVFQKQLEVFKNEIYPKHGTSGIGYNVDLSVIYGPNMSSRAPAEIILERRFVSNENTFQILDHGFLRFQLLSGRLDLDLDEFPTASVHLE